MLGNLNDFNYEKNAIDLEQMVELDKWILNSTLELKSSVEIKNTSHEIIKAKIDPKNSFK